MIGCLGPRLMPAAAGREGPWQGLSHPVANAPDFSLGAFARGQGLARGQLLARGKDLARGQGLTKGPGICQGSMTLCAIGPRGRARRRAELPCTHNRSLPNPSGHGNGRLFGWHCFQRNSADFLFLSCFSACGCLHENEAIAKRSGLCFPFFGGSHLLHFLHSSAVYDVRATSRALFGRCLHAA